MKEIITLSFETLLSSITWKLWGSSVMEGVLQGLLLWPLPPGCPANALAGQEVLPRQNCQPAAPPREVPSAFRKTAWGWPGRPCPQLKARRHAFAVTSCSGGKSWLFWQKQIKACLMHTNFLPDTWPESIWSDQPSSRMPPALSIPTTMTGTRRPTGKEQAES